MSVAHQATAVAIDGRAVLIEGPPGSGKSSLALALIDQGAVLIGDDAVLLQVVEGRLLASPHPRVTGLIEVRNVGLVTMPVVAAVPVALVLLLDRDAPRYVETAELVERGANRDSFPVPFWEGAGGARFPDTPAPVAWPHPNRSPEGEGFAKGQVGMRLPMLRLWPDSPALALRAQWALRQYGLAR